MSPKGWDAWTALKQAGGAVSDRGRYDHNEWIPLYEAVAAGRMIAKDDKGRNISELFGGPTGLYVDPWYDTAQGSGYRFEGVCFWPSNSPVLKRGGREIPTDEETAASFQEHVAAILKDKKRPPITKEDDVWRRGAGATVVQMRKLRDKYRKAKGLK